MFNYRILAVIKRELRERVLSKSFIISTLSLPLIMMIFIGFQVMMVTMESDTDMKLIIASENSELSGQIEEAFSKQAGVKEGRYKLEFQNTSKEEFKALLEKKKPLILDDKLTGLVFISSEAHKNKQIELYTKSAKNLSLEIRIGSVLNNLFINKYFEGKDVSREDLTFAKTRVQFSSFKVTKDVISKDTGGSMGVAFIFSFLLYISLIMMGTWIMQSVLEEKSDRICEVLLSSVNSKELMGGKIVGSSLTGLLQVTIWLIPIFILTVVDLTKLTFLPENIVANISRMPFNPANFLGNIEPTLFIYFLLNFLLGVLTYVGLFAAVGAIYNNAQEAQSGVTPLMMLIILPFFINFSLAKNPENLIALVSSMLPFASIMVMPARLTLGVAPAWQVAVSIAVNIATLFAIFPIAGKLYKVGILRTGKKPSIKELFKWLKMS